MTADKLLTVAVAEIGNKETPININKYGAMYGWNGVAWCVQFVWACFKMAEMSELFYGGKKTASCGAVKKYAEASGLWVTGQYRRGDLVIMDFPGDKYTTNHIGIVESVDGSILTTIEGNTSADNKGSQDNGDGVYRRRRDTKKVKIVGAYRPEYYPEEEEMTQEQFNSMMNVYLRERSEAEPAEWSKTAREWAEENGYIKGDQNGKRHYLSFCTREELVQILYNMKKEN